MVSIAEVRPEKTLTTSWWANHPFQIAQWDWGIPAQSGIVDTIAQDHSIGFKGKDGAWNVELYVIQITGWIYD